MSTRTQNKGFRSNEQNVDLYFSSNGDFRLGVGGDIERTIGYPHQALIQTVTKRLSSSAGDWPAQQSIGANLGDFAGQENSRETAQLIKSRIVTELTRGNLVSASNLRVQMLPLSTTSIIILLFIKSDDSSQPISFQFSYDMRDNKLIPRNL